MIGFVKNVWLLVLVAAADANRRPLAVAVSGGGAELPLRLEEQCLFDWVDHMGGFVLTTTAGE